MAGINLLPWREWLREKRRKRYAMVLVALLAVAAAGLYALDHQVARLADDHANAQLLADGLRAAGYDVEPVQTNMVYAQVGDRAEALKAFAAQQGIRLSAAPRLRMVTHMDVSRSQIEQVIAVFAEFSRQ